MLPPALSDHPDIVHALLTKEGISLQHLTMDNCPPLFQLGTELYYCCVKLIF